MICFDAIERPAPASVIARLHAQGVHPLMAQLFAARGITEASEIGGALGDLIPPSQLTHSELAATLLADAIIANKSLLIVGDYDCDGATATAVAVSALKALDAKVDFLIPHRITHGYGLTDDIVRRVIEREPDWVITVDSGISDIDSVDRIKAAGIGVIITDHHLPSVDLPVADVIVNPNLANCAFPSKNLAGVGVIFYVMLQLRAQLRNRGFFASRAEPNLARYLDLVALGTVADMVPLDRNNRILVAEGLKRIRSGYGQPGLVALLAVSGRHMSRATTEDFGFFVAPRLNAAGRLGDMSLSVETLLATEPVIAKDLAGRLDKLNRQRQAIQNEMIDCAERQLVSQTSDHKTIVLYDKSWHEGVIGIVAGRLKDRCQKPTFIFAAAQDNALKGSGRSTPAIHLHEILLAIDVRHPGLLKRFGGHAAAAGVTIDEGRFDDFRLLFETFVVEKFKNEVIRPTLEFDGSLDPGSCDLETARLIEEQVWGSGFPTPLFVDCFQVDKIRAVGERHMSLLLKRGSQAFEAIQFHVKQIPDLNGSGNFSKIAYRLATDRFRNHDCLRLQIEEWVK